MKTLEGMPATLLPRHREEQPVQGSRAAHEKPGGGWPDHAQFDEDLGDWEPIGLVVIGVLRKI